MSDSSADDKIIFSKSEINSDIFSCVHLSALDRKLCQLWLILQIMSDLDSGPTQIRVQVCTCRYLNQTHDLTQVDDQEQQTPEARHVGL